MTTQKKLYRVLREHDSDRFYREGETRMARVIDVAHLIPRVLEEIEAPLADGPAEDASNATTQNAPAGDAREDAADAKAEDASASKSESAAPEDKAEGRKATKQG